MKFIETYQGLLVNTDDISYFENDYDEDKGYSISIIVLKNGNKIQFINTVKEFRVEKDGEFYEMADFEMSLLHKVCIIHFSDSSKTVITYKEIEEECWRSFLHEFKHMQ